MSCLDERDYLLCGVRAEHRDGVCVKQLGIGMGPHPEHDGPHIWMAYGNLVRVLSWSFTPARFMRPVPGASAP